MYMLSNDAPLTREITPGAGPLLVWLAVTMMSLLTALTPGGGYAEYCVTPEVQALPKLGGLDDAQVERIARLKPDLVLAAPSARAVERLEALGLPVMVLHTRSHAEVRRALQLIAAVVGDAAAAERVWQRIEAQFDLAAARVPQALRGRSVYFEVETAPYAAGPGSFIGQSLQRLGLLDLVRQLALERVGTPVPPPHETGPRTAYRQRHQIRPAKRK